MRWALDQDAFAAVLQQVFAAETGSAAAMVVRDRLLGEGLGIGLDIQPLPGLRGAYAAASGFAPELVLLDGAWLAAASAEELEAVLLEEIGHAIDQRLNGVNDSPGDEGERFSALLRGALPSAASASENDQHWIEVASELRLVEAAAATKAPRVSLFGARNPAFAGSALFLPDVRYMARPIFADIDGDGDLDAFVGERYGSTIFFRNTGSATSAAFAASSVGFGLPDVGTYAFPSLVDIDDDGDLDLFIGNNVGNTLFFRNSGNTTTPAFQASATPFGLPDVGSFASPTFVDIDADGDFDAFIGVRNGNTLFYRNTGSRTNPLFGSASTTLPDVGDYARPTFGDVDADGDLDAFIGNTLGSTIFFRNTGTRFLPSFASSSIGFGLPDVGSLAAPFLADIDGDADLDLFIGNRDGNTLYFRNTGTDGLTSAAASGTYVAGNVITIRVPFTDIVGVNTISGTPTLLLETGTIDRTAVYVSGNGTNVLNFQYTVQNGDASLDLDFASTTALQLNGALIRDAAGNDANLTLPAPGTAGSLGANAALVIDALGPSVAPPGLTSSNANSTYAAGSVITLRMSFTEPAIVNTTNGTPTLLLETGSIDRTATYVGGSGTSSLSFSYTVQVGDQSADLDVASTTALQLNGATIRDAVGNNAVLTVPAPGTAGSLAANAALVIDAVAPSVAPSGLTSTNPDGSYGIGSVITLQVPFSEPVIVNTTGGTPTLLLETGIVDQSATYTGGSGTNTLSFQYTVMSGDISSDLDVTSTTALQLNGATIKDSAGNNASLLLQAPGSPGSLGANAALVIAGLVPTVAASGPISITADGLYGAANVITIQVPFTKVVNVNTAGGTPTLLLETGRIDRTATYSGGSGTNTLSFVYTVQDGDSSTDLDVSSSMALQLNGATIRDASGNNAILTLPAPGAAGSLAANAALVIDAVAPAVANNGSSNPSFAGSSIGFGLPNVGNYAAFPTFADIDSDGDLDAFIGNQDGNILFFRNTGTPVAAAFSGSSIGFGLPDMGNAAHPSFGDIDADGDLDVFIGIDTGVTLFFRNTGTSASAAFAASSIGYGIPAMTSFASPILADVDSDADLDLFIGADNGNTFFFRNTGTPTNAAFAASSIGFDLPDVGLYANPALADIDGDGDLDAFIGEIYGNTLFFRNTGSPTSPVFAGSSIGFDFPDVGLLASPTFVDIDGDGDLDAFIGHYDGNTLFFRNSGSSGLTSPNANDTYRAGGLITIQVPFTEDVFVSGTPRLQLETGSTDRFAIYNGGGGSAANILSFVYYIQDGDVSADLDITSTTALQLNGGTIRDRAGNNASLTLPAPGGAGSLAANANLVIDAQAPTLSGSTPADGAIGVSEPANLQLSFSESIQPGSGQIRLWRADGVLIEWFDVGTGSGNAGGSLLFSGSTITIDPNADLDSSTSFYLTIASTAITDVAGNAYAGISDATTLNFSTGDSSFPTITAVSSTTANGTYGPGAQITLSIGFSEAVIVNSIGGVPSLLLETGSMDRTATYFSGSGTNTLSFRYTVQSGDSSADLDATSATALQLNGGTIRDGAGNNAILTLPAPGAAGSLAANAALVIDGVAPAVAFNGSRNPAFAGSSIGFGLPNAGFSASPTFVDIDADGDLDAFIGYSNGNTVFFRNTGTPTNPAFAASSIGFGLANVGYSASPTFVDIDADGDLDAFIGNHAGLLSFFRNTGTPLSPAFASSSIGFGLPVVASFTSPSFADIDSDGDFDLFIGNDYGNTLFFRNTGTSTTPRFAGSSIAFGLSDVGFDSSPSFVDIEGDGDLDAFIGEFYGNTIFFRNTGTSTSPAFAAGTITFGLTDVGFDTRPAFADIDGDGDVDAFIGNMEGNTLFFRNTGLSSLSSTTANGAYGVGKGITILVPFNEVVTVNTTGGMPTLLLETGSIDRNATYISGSGTKILRFQYTVQSGDSSVDLDIHSTSALRLNGATIRDAVGNNADLTLPAPGTAGSLAAVSALVIDGVVPVVAAAGLTSSTANGTYRAGAVITIRVPFTKIVSVNTAGGTPTLLLETGSIDRAAVYSSGSGTNTLSFQYTVQSGDSSADLDVLSSAALQLNGGTIRDGIGNDATLTLPAPGTARSLAANAALVIDTEPPVVGAAGLSSTNANGVYSAGAVITIRVPFSKVVAVNTTGGVPTLLLETGLTDRAAIYSGGSGTNTLSFQYAVQSGDSSADLDVTSSAALALNGGTILDAAGNNATLILPLPGQTGSLAANAALVIDTVSPAVAAAGLTSPTANGTYGAGSVITIQVPFTEVVNVTTGGGTPTLLLETGSIDRTATYSGGSGTSTLSFQYTVQSGDNSADLDVASATALQLNGATIRDVAGNNASLLLSAPGLTGSLAANASLVVEGVAPAVTSAGLTSSNANGIYSADGVITILVPFTEVVLVNSSGGIPSLLLETGTTDRTATYAGGSGTTTLRFQYTVQSGDRSGDLDVTSTTALQLNGATIRDAAGNNANVLLPAPGTTGSLGANAALEIQGVAPALASPGLISLTANGTHTIGTVITIQVPFSAAVTVNTTGGFPTLLLETGSIDRAATYTGGSGTNMLSFHYTVQSGDSSPDLDVASATALQLNGATIRDAAGNNASLLLPMPGTPGSLAANADLVIEGAEPAVASRGLTSTSANGVYGIGTAITIQVPFTKVVTVDTTGGAPTLLLETGITDRIATYSAGSGTNTLGFVYTVQSGDSSADLDVASATALRLNGATIRDAVGNNASLILPVPGDTGSLGANSALVIDALAPSVAVNGAFSPGFAGPSIGFGLPNVGAFLANPTFADSDADGDLDAFIGTVYGSTLFFRNTGTPTSAAFAGSSIGFGLPKVDGFASPSFADIDADGDLDAFIGEFTGNTLLFLNTGSSATPAFAGSSLSFGLGNLGFAASPAFADIDADGDFDAFIGFESGNTLFFRNSGSPTNPAFADASIGFGLPDVGTYAHPSFVDIDGDGDLDAFIGNRDGSVLFFRNTGTAASAAFAESSIGFGLPIGSLQASPSFADIDADGDVDAFVGDYQGNTLFFRNTGSSLTSSTTNGTYTPGSLISLQVAFSETVLVDTTAGIPTLSLETGAIDRAAIYSGGSGTNILSFQYTVQSGDSAADLDVTSSNALQLNGATIRDGAGNTARLTLPAPGTTGSLGANAALVMDGVAPTLSGCTPAPGATNVLESANPQLTFSEAVRAGTGWIELRRADGALIESFDVATGGGLSGGTLVFSGNTISLDSIFTLASNTGYYLTIPGSAITDEAGNAYAGITQPTALTFSTGDSLAPTVSAVTTTSANGPYGLGAQISLAIRFSEPVIVNLSSGVPSLLLETGASDRPATYLSGSGSDTLTFTYTVQSGDSSADLEYTSTSALQLNGGTIRDAANNDASLALPAPGTRGSLASSADLAINGTNPQNLTLTSATPTVNEGSNLSVTLKSTTLAPGATLYWSFSGAGITADDLFPATLVGSLNLGIDRGATFTRTVALDGIKEADETLTLTVYSDPARTLALAGAQFTLRDQTPTGLDGATDARDLIVGTSGDDIITGVPVGSLLNGKGSYDTLTGNGGNDIFVLGTASSVYYNDGDGMFTGTSDLAAITDFNAGDRIHLKGAPAHYRLSNASLFGVSGSLLSWRASAGAGSADEAIGFIQRLTTTSLSLTNTSQFLYV